MHMGNHIMRTRSIVTIASVTLFVLLFATTALPRVSADGPYPTYIRGYIWDSEHNPVPGADVTVTTKDGPTTIHTESTTSDQYGYYNTLFSETEWFVGCTIEVVATFDGMPQDGNSADAILDHIQYVDVTFLFEIPQFSNMTGLLLTSGFLGAVGAVAVVWRRKR